MSSESVASRPRAAVDIAPSRPRSRALLGLLVALVALGLGIAAPAANAADREFAPRFSVNDTGDIDIVGNSSMTCPTAALGCTAAQQSGVTTLPDATSQNNAYNMQFVDVDSDASTFNSSRATVSIPSGSTVLFAGLYWGGRAVGASGFAQRGTVKLRTPATAGYASLTATTLDDGGTAGATDSIYQGFVDVTSRVQAGGSGVYTVADIQAATGSDKLAGWSLVVAYRNTGQPARSLTVFDGLKSIGSGATGTINVAGFTTPPSGAVNTRVGFVSYEGDGGIIGDSASLNSTVLSDAQHPATNFFNSRSSRDGARRTGQDPSYPNQLGIEQSILLANGVLANNATNATVRLTSSGDVYAPGVVTFATELYAPKVDQTKTVVDVNGGDVEQGDVLRYTIAGRNTGQDGARDFVVRDPIPTNTSYVAGSLKVTPTTGGVAGAETAVTDGSGDDRGEFDAAGGRIVARVGTGATATAGGSVAVSGTAASYAVTFDVRVGGPSPALGSDSVITNTATASYASQSLGTPLTAQSTVASTVRTPDLTLTKVGQGTITRGRPYTYRVTARNDGDARTQGTVTVTDTLPAGLTAGTNAASGTGWTCTNTSTTFTCTRADTLAAGAAYPGIDVVVNVASDAPATVANTAAVSGGGDGDPSNNTATATNGPVSSADLAVQKTASATTAPVGGTVSYALRVTNTGPSRSAGSVVTDALPAGLTYVSSTVGCAGTAASSTVTCTVGALASGATADFTVVAKPAAGTAGSTLRNTATVAGTDPDPTDANNSSAVSVDVRPVDLRITSTIQGTPAVLNPNTTYTWLVGVTNDGGSAAPSSIVRFDVPAGTTADAATIDSRCTLSGATGNQLVTCNLGTIDPAGGTGATPLRIPLTTTADPGPSIATSASVSTTETDRDLGNNTATTSTPVVQSVDLGVSLAAVPGPVRPGENLTISAEIRNVGPARPVAPKVTIPLPDGTTFVSAPAGCAVNAAGTAVVCDLPAADLDAGESLNRAIVVKVGANPGPSIAVSAAASTTSPDTNSSNDRAALVVPVIESVDLGVTLTSDPGTARPGQNLTLTAVVRNTGPGRPVDPKITVPLPTGTTFVSAPAGCVLSGDGSSVVCDLPAADLDTNESLTRAIVVKVGDAPPAALAASATVSTTSTDTNAGNDRATLTVPVVQTVDLGVTVTASPNPVRPGENLTLNVGVRNDGAARPGTPRVTVPLPAGTTFVSAPAGCAVNAAGTAVVCDLPADGLDAGESLTRAIVVKVGANPGPTIPVSATVSTTSTDTNAANDRATTSVAVIETVDLGVTLTSDPGTARPGQNLTLTATVTNTGPGRPAAPTVTIPLPTGTTFVSAANGCALNAAGTAVVCDLPADGLDTNETLTRSIVVRVGDAPGANLVASATVATTSTDTNAGNDRATLTVPVVQTVDLGVTLTAGPSPVRPGENLTLTAVVRNDGAARPVQPQVTIPLPAGTTFVSGPAGCAPNALGTAIVCDLPADGLDNGESLTRAIVVKVGADPGPTIPVSATVSTTSTDTNTANDRATTTVPVIETVDLATTIAADPGTARPGQNLTLTATVTNTGPGRPVDPKVTIPVPTGTTFVSAPAGCALNAAGTAVVCDLTPADLDRGESLTRAIVVKVGDAPGASITASATASTTSTDTNAANDRATLTVPVVQTVDLGVTVTGAPGPVRPGENLTLTTVVRNDGAARPVDPKVTVPLPAGTTFVSAPAGCAVNAAGTAVVCDLPADGLDAGESLTRAIVVKVGANPGPSIAVSAAVSTTSTDTNAANDRATGTVPVIETVDLGVALSAAPGTARPGQNLTLTATIRNDGFGRPDAPRVTIPLPAGTTFVSAPAGCALNAGGTAVVCDLPADGLDAGETLTRAIVVKVGDTPGASIAASATVSTTSTDTNAANDRATLAVPVNQTVDLGVTLTGSPNPVRPGQDLTLTAVVKNDGAARPTDPRVTVPLPAGTTFVSAPTGCAVNAAGTAVVCDLPADGLDAGESLTRAIVVRVAGDPGPSIAAAATVTTTSTDTDAANDRATATIPVIETVDLATTLTSDPATVRAGQNLTLTATVTNNGPGRPEAPRVTVPIPAGTTFVSAPAGCALNAAGSAVVCDLTPAELDKGESVTRAIVVKVGDAPPASLAASATASTTSTDTNAGNDRATLTVPVQRDVDLGITLSADPGTTSVGEDVTLTAVIKNDGAGRPTDPKVTVPLPTGTTVVGPLPAGCALNAAGTAVVCDLTASDLDAGESVTKTIVVRVGNGAGTSLAFSATASTTSNDTNRANDRADVTVPVTAGSDVEIRKSASKSVFQGGDTVSYTLTARNNGPATARNVRVADDVPAALDVVGVTPSAANCTVTGNAVRCELGTLAPNTERAITVQTRAKATASSPASTSIAPKIKLTREERYETLEPGQTRTIDVRCEEGENTADPADDRIGIATDGTLQVVDITSGKESVKDVRILRASTTSASTYRFVVENATTGTAQVRPHVTCLPPTTDDGQHELVAGPLRTQTRTLPAGRAEFFFPVAGGDRAIAPGVETDGGQVRLVGSEPVDGGWKLVVDVLQPATVTASLRDLDDLTSASGDPLHVHALTFAHVEKTVTLQPGEWLRNSNDRSRVSCNDDTRQGYEGIVASYDLPIGVISTGNIPMPVNRDFDLLNTTDQVQTFKIDLECVRLQTGDPITVDDVVNTGTISSAAGDTNTDNNRSSARIVLERKPEPVVAPVTPAPTPAPATPAPAAPAPAPAPAPSVAPAPAATQPSTPSAPATPSTPAAPAPRASILSSALRVTGTTSKATVAVPVSCAKACTGTATLSAISAVRGTSIKKGAVLAKASVRLAGGKKKSTVRLVARGKLAKALRRGGVRRAKLSISTGRGATVVRTVRIVLK
ncbi:hypothetical protein [Patulibacter sp.]|uniref:hypothetical protein n=1 Tax=Patulibacter sp. TaxID=1912859 RepID=UPI002723AD7B|nr:hypothetical protein [Patulibacter sp.]MDO9408551.1 hypothetical protein [Patulibacter sp.]